MLENYFGTQGNTEEQRKRLLAVQAALEIAKASVSASSATTVIKSGYDIDYVTEKVSALADAIQDALVLESE